MDPLDAARGWDGGGSPVGESGWEGYSWVEWITDTESFGVALWIGLLPLAWYSQVPRDVYCSFCGVPSDDSIPVLNVAWCAETAIHVENNPVPGGGYECRKPWMFCMLTYGPRPRRALPWY